MFDCILGQNVDLVRATWEAWEGGQADALIAFYDPAVAWDQTGYSEGSGLSGVFCGHDGIKRFFR